MHGRAPAARRRRRRQGLLTRQGLEQRGAWDRAQQVAVVVEDGDRDGVLGGEGGQVQQQRVRTCRGEVLDQDVLDPADPVPGGADEPVVAGDAEQSAVVGDDVDAVELGVVEPGEHLTRRRVRWEGLAGLAHGQVGGQHAGAVDVGDEVGHVLVGRVVDDLGAGPDLHHGPVLHHHDAVPDPHGLVEVVGDEHDRAVQLLLQLHQQVLHVPTDQRVEGGEGLVHQQDVGVGREAAGDPDPLLHAAGHLVRVLVRPPLEAHACERLLGPLATLVLVHTLDLEAVGGVLAHGAVREQREVLEDHRHVLGPQPPQLLVVELRDVLAVDLDRSPGGLDEAVEHADHGRLARSRQAHHHEQLALVDVEADVPHGDDLTCLLEDLRLGAPVGQQVEGALRIVAEDLRQTGDVHRGHVVSSSRDESWGRGPVGRAAPGPGRVTCRLRWGAVSARASPCATCTGTELDGAQRQGTRGGARVTALLQAS